MLHSTGTDSIGVALSEAHPRARTSAAKLCADAGVVVVDRIQSVGAFVSGL